MITNPFEDDPESGDKDTPPYLSGTTFLNFIDAHRRTLPTRIDRSIMSNLSGGDQVRILRALRFFGLTNAEGVPTVDFQKLALLDGDDMPNAWNKLIRNAYPYLFSDFNLEKATQAHIEERFREQGIKGETARKAVTFFITLAKAAGLTLSPYFKSMRPRGPRGPRVPRRAATRTTKAPPDPTPSEEPPTAPPSSGTSAKKIRFRSGGTAELRVDVDVVSLSREDREALFAWIDSMTEYENGAQAGT